MSDLAVPQDAFSPGAEHFAGNLIDGRWSFPVLPYDYEVRSPLNSTVIATVPLSSRLDVDRAVAAARNAAIWEWADAGTRARLLDRLVGELDRHAGELAELQVTETGLTPAESSAAVTGGLRLARTIVAAVPDGPPAGVSGHILSWGLPVVETMVSVLPALARGHTAVIKPSLRAPLSVMAVAWLATRIGFPPGVLNVVQGTGVDAGAALAGTYRLAELHVHGNERTRAQARRAAARTGARLVAPRAGGNVVIAGPSAPPARVAKALSSAASMHSAGGLLALPALAAHADVAAELTDAVLAALASCRPAPLPAEPLRERALTRVTQLRAAGARLLAGGTVPDDVPHRMGWILPPVVLELDDAALVYGAHSPEPLGPVLTITTWHSADQLASAFDHPRHGDGIACVWGTDGDPADLSLPHGAVLRDTAPAAALGGLRPPPTWTGTRHCSHAAD
jgi:acyl-CoA reductase-like NAD-dependent aldehyde dehydrogenase